MDSATRMRSNGGKARAKLDKSILSAIGRKGGEARRDSLTPAERSAAARRAVNKRWADVRAKARKRRPRGKAAA